jgi:hypothetical protein
MGGERNRSVKPAYLTMRLLVGAVVSQGRFVPKETRGSLFFTLLLTLAVYRDHDD